MILTTLVCVLDFFCFYINLLNKNIHLKSSSRVLTFDLDEDGVANAPQVVVGHADILPSVLLRHVEDLQSLVVVLKLDFVCWQVTALLEPLDGGGRPAGGTRSDQTVDFALASSYCDVTCIELTRP